MDAPPQVAAGTLIGGDFRIQRPLSAGGMGAVYVAEQLSTGKPRALKLMHPQLVSDPKSRLRFIDEARVGARIPSEHVVEVVGAGVDDATGVPWLAMELLEGEDLSAIVERTGPLPVASARELMLQLGHALGAAHGQSIVHRDLKPENVFVARSRRRGAELTVKVLDFGIAKTLESSRTAATATAAMGSPLFMAPEQATPGAAIRPQTDVWALGLIGLYALTGRFYWRSASIEPFSLQALLAEVLVHPMPTATERLRELGAAVSLPPGFDAWFARCVARDPAGRFSDASACVAAFDAMLQGNLHPSMPGQVALAATAAMGAVTPMPGGYGAGPYTPPPGHATPPLGGHTPPPVASTAYMQPMPGPPPTYATPTRSGGGLLGMLAVIGAVGLLAIVGIGGAVAAWSLSGREDPVPLARAAAGGTADPAGDGSNPPPRARARARARGRTGADARAAPRGRGASCRGSAVHRQGDVDDQHLPLEHRLHRRGAPRRDADRERLGGARSPRAPRRDERRTHGDLVGGRPGGADPPHHPPAEPVGSVEPRDGGSHAQRSAEADPHGRGVRDERGQRHGPRLRQREPRGRPRSRGLRWPDRTGGQRGRDRELVPSGRDLVHRARGPRRARPSVPRRDVQRQLPFPVVSAWAARRSSSS
ncbi:MAG: protein kinase [Sandaracinaceae bacterium]